MFNFQRRVADWVIAVFGLNVLYNKQERSERFIEEAIELVQACDLPKERVQVLLDRVYDRPPGVIGQEIGGVCVTLAALCETHEKMMETCGYVELRRIENPDLWPKLRESHASKPRST